MDKRKLAIWLSGAVVIIIVGGYIINLVINNSIGKQKALQMSDSCRGNDRVECLSAQITTYSSYFPKETRNIFDEFWKLEKDGMLSDDSRIFSDIAQNAGVALIEKDVSLDKSLLYCGTTFNGECIRGAVMQYVDTEYPSDIEPQKLFKLCQSVSKDRDTYLNCLHGVGHELTAKNDLAPRDVLDLCGSLSGEELSACTSGALMEYSKGAAGSGSHSDLPVGKIELPCIDLKDRDQSVCYSSAGAFRQYEPKQEDFSKSYDFCFISPKEHINDCVMGLSERVLLATNESQKKINAICMDVSSKEIERACIKSIQRLKK